MAGGSGKVPELVHLPGFHEPFSAISHLLGAAAFLILGFLLVRRGGGDRARMAALGIYAGSVVLLLSVSGVYHMLARGSGAHWVLARLDHGAIFVLIAGTFTPTLFILFRGWLRWGQLVLIWGAAVAALTVKMIYFDVLAEWLGLSIYLTLGWFGGVPAILLARRYGFAFIRPLIGGGLAYSIGGVIDLVRWPTAIPGVVQSHEVAHVAVLAGMALHWRFIRQFARIEPLASP